MTCIKIICIYIGLIIGAGFASGREICEYFNFASNTDFTGVCIATILFAFICYIILKKSYKYELYNIKDYVSNIFSFSKLLQKIFLFIIFLDLICGFIVMMSSCGEVIGNFFDVPKIVGCLFLAVICFFIFIFDIKGIAVINIILVPIIIAIIIFITLNSIFTGQFQSTFAIGIKPEVSRNILLLAICYVGYNTLTAASVLSPIAKEIKNYRTIILSSVLCGVIVGTLIFIVWFALGINFSSIWYESFPLQKLAKNINNNIDYIYLICLIMSILTTSVSEGYGILSYFNLKTKLQYAIASLILLLVILPFSLIDFVYLVKYLYYYLGMLGVVWMAIIMLDYLKNLKHL